MRISLRLWLILLIFLSCRDHLVGQEQSRAILIDEIGLVCSELLAAKYDMFIGQVAQNPTARGYMLFYGDDELEGRNLNYISYLSAIYPSWKRLDDDHYLFVRGGDLGKMKVQFWIVPINAEPPTPNIKYKPTKITKTILFDKGWADFTTAHGALDIYENGFLEWGCDFSPNIYAFSQYLRADSGLTGYLIIYTKFGKGSRHGRRVSNFATNDLVRNYHVARSQLKAIYGGNRKAPEIELWLVPKGDRFPDPILK